MTTGILESMLLLQDGYNLVHAARYRTGMFGSCANYGRWDTLPMGCDVRATTQELPATEETLDGYKVYQKSIDIGGGNYLAVRYTTKPSGFPHNGGSETYFPALAEPPAPNHDGPPCRCGYFEEFTNVIRYGWMNTERWLRYKDEEKTKEALDEIRALRGTIAFLLSYEQLNNFKTLLVEPVGWTDKIVWESPPIHNRNHPTAGNTLTLFVIQIKD